jgi:CDP-glycerol glycerophosphotransferase
MKHLIKSLLSFGYQQAFRIVSLLPRNKKVVVFESFHGKQFSDNPRAIYEYMKENNPEYTLYWSADRRHTKLFAEVGVPYVPRLTVKWLFIMGRAEYWVANTRLPNWLPKPKGTTYLQTWHGTPLKKLGIDIEDVKMPGTNTEQYKEHFIEESSKWDYLISPNSYSTQVFKRAFGFGNTMLETGYPRNDFLTNSNNDETITSIKDSLGIPKDKKVILYAPTWRDNQFYDRGKYKFDLQLDLEKMQQELGEDHVIVLRLHYLVAENLDISAYKGFVYDCSHYRDIRDLYLIADILITDYSSVFFDYAILQRPIIFFVYDIEEYRDDIRGFYFKFEEKAPGPLVKTTDEVIDTMRSIEANGFEMPERFYHVFCHLEDGHATERVVEQVFQ